MQKNHFLLLKKLKNTKSAQLCLPNPSVPSRLEKMSNDLKICLFFVFFCYNLVFLLFFIYKKYRCRLTKMQNFGKWFRGVRKKSDQKINK